MKTVLSKPHELATSGNVSTSILSPGNKGGNGIMGEKTIITKASGEQVAFSEEKLRRSLLRSGASEEQISHVIEAIGPKLYPGISTRKIYRLASGLLRGNSRHFAARYSLKKAIMELGPSGFPFEKYVGEILRVQGYSVQTGQMINGKCVRHEVDVIAEKDGQMVMIECKYHNQPGIFCDVKVPLYIHSRFNDIAAERSDNGKDPEFKRWLVTNTRFSNDAIQYGTCAGLKLVGWDYPIGESVKDLVDRLALFPITCLTSLTRHEKQRLLEKNIVLCREIIEAPKLLEQLGIPSPRRHVIIEETRALCSEPGSEG